MPIEGSTLSLGDVANVVEDHQPLIGDAITNDGPSLLLVVEKFPGANTLEVTRGVEEALAAMRPGLPGIEIDTTIYRPADLHRDGDRQSRHGAAHRGYSAGALVLGAFFFDWRTVLDQPRGDPVVADGRRAGALPARRRPSI